jgi:thiamine pyrophosphokinase
MSVEATRGGLPQHNESIGVVCNGELASNEDLIKRINACAHLVAVDGGLNHCDRLQLNPGWVVGDLDSVTEETLSHFPTINRGEKLPRAKDETDLTVGLKLAHTIDEKAKKILFGALGGRVDHSLSNVFQLLRNPLSVYIETKDQLLFGVDPFEWVSIPNSNFQHLSFIPLDGAATDVKVLTNKGAFHTDSISSRTDYLLESEFSFKVGRGQLIVSLRKEPPTHFSQELNFGADESFASLFQILTHFVQTAKPGSFIGNDDQKIFVIHPSFGKLTFPCEIGQTISLIPFGGPAKGIESNHLKWELGKEISELNKDFVGVSNLAMDKEFSISLKEGVLLCVVNSFIDLEMVDL